MSETTRDALEQALTTHIQDEAEKPFLVTGFVIGAAISSFDVSEPDLHSYWFETPQNQPIHISRGLSVLLDEWASSVDLDITLGEED